jgi:hypothetical protein
MQERRGVLGRFPENEMSARGRVEEYCTDYHHRRWRLKTIRIGEGLICTANSVLCARALGMKQMPHSKKVLLDNEYTSRLALARTLGWRQVYQAYFEKCAA